MSTSRGLTTAEIEMIEDETAALESIPPDSVDEFVSSAEMLLRHLKSIGLPKKRANPVKNMLKNLKKKMKKFPEKPDAPPAYQRRREIELMGNMESVLRFLQKAVAHLVKRRK